VPTVDTIHAYLVYKVTWTFGGVLAGAQPPGLPTTYNVMTQDPGNVATTTLPVVAEHTAPTCFSGTGSKQQCNVNEQPGQGNMGEPPINGLSGSRSAADDQHRAEKFSARRED